MFFCWGALLLVVAAAVGGVAALYRINGQIRQYVLLELEKLYPDLEIHIGKVSLNEHRGISIRHLECFIPAEPGRPKRALLAIDELYLECPISLQSLYRKEIEIEKVTLKSPIVRLTRSANGRFEEIERLRTQGSTFRPIPMEVQNGILLFEDILVHPKEPIKFSGIALSIIPPQKQAKPVLITDLEKKQPPSDAWSFSGSMSGDLLRQLKCGGFYRPSDRYWEFSASCRQFDWTPELLAYFRLEAPLIENRNHQRSLESFQGRFDFGFSAVHDPQIPWGFRFAMDGMLSQGRIELHEIGRTLTELNTRFEMTDHSLHIEKLSGIAEAARLLISYSQQGLPAPTSAQLSAEILGLSFDVDFVEALSPFLTENTQNLLRRFDFEGTTNLETKLSYQNGHWQPESLQLALSDLKFTFLEFPYSVEHLSGVMQVDSQARLNFTLAGRPTDSLRTRIVGEYVNVFVDPVGQVAIRGRNVPIDAKLMETLPEAHRAVVQSLHPAGKIDAELLIKLPPDDNPLEKHFVIHLDKVSLQYDRFPYPLREVSGELRLDDDIWTFENIVGTNESARIVGSGRVQPVVRADGSGENVELTMKIQAEDVPVDGQLAGALLDPGQRQLLEEIRARGKIHLNTAIRYVSHENRLDLAFQAVPCPEFSIHPARFPYRIDNLQGEFRYENGSIYSPRLTGNHREVRLSCGVLCRFDPDDRWVMRLDPLVIDHLSADRELLDALPSNAQKIFEDLQIAKPFNFKGLIEFSRQGPDTPLCTVWDIGAVFHQNAAHVGVPVDNIFGEIKLTGFAQDDTVRFGGELKLDSFTVHDFHLTDIAGPFFYEGQAKQFLIGQQAKKHLYPPPDLSLLHEFRQSPWFLGTEQARPIVGRLFGGVLRCEGLVVTGETVSYNIHSILTGADLATIAMEFEPNASKISGTMNLGVRIQGAGRKLETIGGEGNVQLRNANIYEAPGMLKLLRELSIREINPNAGAFSSADIGFFIQGKQLVLNPILFEGGAFSLEGNGKMQIDTRHVDLIMRTRLGNRKTQIPIVTEIIGGAGDQIIQHSVQGPISNPTVTRIALPEIQNAIRQIQGEESGDYGNDRRPPPSPADRLRPSKIFPWK